MITNDSECRAGTKPQYYKHVSILLALYITFLLLVVSLANRFVEIGNMLEAGGIFVFPLTFLICDIVSEVYGYSLARKFIWIGAFCEFVFAFVTTLETHLPYPISWHYSQDYKIVFAPTLRYVFSSYLGLILGEFVNVYLISKWKIRLQGRLFWVRSIIATACGQFLLSILVVFTAFAGSLALNSLLWMVFCGFIWKIVSAALLAYPASVLIKFLKSSEDVDVYDINTNFNPFKISG